jgi:polysaccharide pyruvyl transferase WcaK-like protein
MAYGVWLFMVVVGWLLKPFRRRKSRVLRRCLLVTYCGANNTGAEARTKEALRQIREIVGKRTVFEVIALNRENALRYFDEDERLRIVTPGYMFLFDIAKLVLASDMVVLVEGSGFRQNFSSALLWYFLYALGLATILGRTTVAYAVDAGRLTGGNRFFARRVARNVDLLMTRTAQAAEVLRKLGVKRPIYVHTDTAFSLAQPAHTKVAMSTQTIREMPLIGLAFKEFFWYPIDPNFVCFLKGEKAHRFSSFYYYSWNDEIERKSQEFKQMAARLLTAAEERYGARVVLIAMEHMDGVPCEDIAGMMKAPPRIWSCDQHDVAEMTALLRSLDVLITTRYHAFVLSTAAGVPTIAVSHDERLKSVMEEMSLDRDFYFEYDAWTPAELLPKLELALERVMGDRKRISEQIRSRHAEYSVRSLMNQSRFATFLREKHHDWMEQR